MGHCSAGVHSLHRVQRSELTCRLLLSRDALRWRLCQVMSDVLLQRTSNHLDFRLPAIDACGESRASLKHRRRLGLTPQKAGLCGGQV